MNENFKNIKGLIFDYGGTLDSEGRHWSYILREGLKEAGIQADDDTWKDAYVFAERALAKERIIVEEDTFRDVMLKKTGIEIARLSHLGAIALSDKEMKECSAKASEYCYNYAAKCIGRSRKVLEEIGNRNMVLVTNFYGNIQSVLKDFRLDFFKLLHQFFVYLKSACGIYYNCVESVGFCVFDALFGYLYGVTLSLFVNFTARLFADRFKLTYRRGTVYIARHEKRVLALFFKVCAELCNERGFTCALKSRHHYDCGRIIRNGKLTARRPHQLNKLFVDDFYNLLGRT